MQKVLVRTTHVKYVAKPIGASHLLTNLVQTPPLTGESHSTFDTFKHGNGRIVCSLGFLENQCKECQLHAGRDLPDSPSNPHLLEQCLVHRRCWTRIGWPDIEMCSESLRNLHAKML